MGSLILDTLQGHRFSWSSWLLIAFSAPGLLLAGMVEHGAVVTASVPTFLGALVLAWLWVNIIQQWTDRLRFVLVRSAVLGGLWALAVVFNFVVDPRLGWPTLSTGLLPVVGLVLSFFGRRMSVRIQVAELSDEAQEALLNKQQRAVETWRKRPRRKKHLAGALMGLGASYVKLERMDEAREVFMEAGRLFRALNDVTNQTAVLNYLGNAWIDTDPARAVEYYELAWANVEKQERRWGQVKHLLGWADFPHQTSVLLNNLGSAYIKLADVNKARPHLQEALAVLDKAGIETPRFRVIVYLNLSELYQLMGDEAEAHRWAHDAEILLEKRHFMLPAEVDATRKMIAKHYQEKLGMAVPAGAS